MNKKQKEEQRRKATERYSKKVEIPICVILETIFSGDNQDVETLSRYARDYGFVDFKLPAAPNKGKWELVFDTTGAHKKINDNSTYTLEPYSYVLLTSKKHERGNEREIYVSPKVIERD